ncbi:Uncharacterised protein [Streptococcus pneumoniae]|uniref:hypothetical protein n=1 Tax=Streptococcus pneumoniae TaxID=1313 RepID=UPI0005E3BBB9|nr:hypothetical protein [Streptococcus pneumoniae]CIS23539.1 Uncharacterised protein [Streptococcus pneumoniae]CIU10000.1 Uncharacterised protein [Streptococcus pneumoniae]CJC28516.1 Uncharacterised protein [Streptococcus pneumoniae]CJG50755.1 Uncharacterised protein [Streptococcus pneumoniae]CJL22816.1 Uncharacterised protein [Streptococcus pneumoniae]
MIYNREELFLVQQNKKRIILGNKILDIMHFIMKMEKTDKDRPLQISAFYQPAIVDKKFIEISFYVWQMEEHQ